MRRLASIAVGCVVVSVLACRAPAQDAPSSAAKPGGSTLPRLSNREAWERLPVLSSGERDRPLPSWALALAGPLPRTTAAMLELDSRCRTSEAFDPKLRAMLRLAASRANRCEYGERYAEADLKRLGATPEDLESAAAPEQAAIAFAQQLTLAASQVTDEQVAELVEAFGEPAVVAMVLQLAYANFQDRLLLTLDNEVEEGGPLPPLDVRFKAPGKDESIAAERAEAADFAAASETAASETAIGDPMWAGVSLAELLRGMDVQKSRSGRVSVPEFSEVLAKLPAGAYSPDRPLRIKWSLVVLGHQPELGMAWMNCLRTFGREANQDRVFEESLFWVITRSIDCFY